MAWTFGQLRSYGNLTGTAGTDLIVFSGSGAITPVQTGWHSEYQPKLVNPLVNAGYPYPVDTAGLGPTPLDGTPELTYTLQLVAPASYADDAAFYYLRTQFEAVYNFIMGTYSLEGVAGCSGMRGWLVARDERIGTTTLYKLKARCLAPPSYKLEQGLPHTLLLSMTFGMLGSFVAYTP